MMVVAPPCLPIIVRDVIISAILTTITRVMLVESRFFTNFVVVTTITDSRISTLRTGVTPVATLTLYTRTMKCVIIATPAHCPATAHSHTATALLAVITRRLLPVVMLLLTVMTASAQTVKDEDTLHVDFDGWFSTLVNNRKLYNRYNDSIFLIHDHDRWVEFFHTRAALNHDIYQSNKLCLTVCVRSSPCHKPRTTRGSIRNLSRASSASISTRTAPTPFSCSNSVTSSTPCRSTAPTR